MCLALMSGNRRDGSSRMAHERDSNNNRHHAINQSLDKSTTSTGSGQRSPLSSTSEKSCDEQLMLVQQQQQQPQRSMYMAHPQQQQGLETVDSRHLQVPTSTAAAKSLKQEQCDLTQVPFDPHSFTNYSPFAINTLMLHQGFAENPAALNAYYASQLPQTAFVPSSSTDYYQHHHHPHHHASMYASPSAAL